MKKLSDYLYQLDTSEIDYKFASEYYSNQKQNISFGCTSFRAGNYFGRNYDWLYDNSVSFVVKTPRTCNKHAVLGVSGNIPQLTKQFVESGEQSDIYKLIPFVLDGINDSGLVVSMNVVPLDYGVNISIPDIELKHSLCSKMVPRFLLDNFNNAVDAVMYLKNYCSIYPPKSLLDKSYEIHFIVSDASNNTFVIELINNKLNIIPQNVITNFHLSNVKLNKDGSVITPLTQHGNINAASVNNITKYGCGLERFNIVKSLKCPSIDNVRTLLHDLYYSNTYTKMNWFTEFVGNNLTTISTAKEYIEAIAPKIPEMKYEDRDNCTLWQTVHSSLYDVLNKTLELRVQEDFNTIYNFRL